MATATTSRPIVHEGATLHNVEWATYCKLRDEEANNHVRMIYLDGELTIMSPHMRPDMNSRIVLLLIVAVARAWRIELMPIGSTTLKREGRGTLLGAGQEPDEGFFLGDDVARMRRKMEIDLSIDPPPSLAIDVDNTADSGLSLATYARIGVPEVWRFYINDQNLWFGLLEGDHYRAVDRSVGIPRLTRALVLEALDARTRQEDDLDWLDRLDQWARNLPEPN
jgi:Uma2 family endonuclease